MATPVYKSTNQPIFTIANTVEQFDDTLPRRPVNTRKIDTSGSVFMNTTSMLRWDQLKFRKYDNLTSRAINNTFMYMFNKFKKGMFVSINEGRLRAFTPFNNSHYRNEWSYLLKVDAKKYPSIQALIDKTSSALGFTPKIKHKPLNEWQANDAMFRFDHTENGTNIAVYNDMMTTLCIERDIPDVEVFINKRDYPLLKQNETEPYENLYGSMDQKLVSHNYDQYAPILSGSIMDEYADLLIPTHEDWVRARYQRDGVTLPAAYKTYPVIQHNVPWASKNAIAVFRGTSTGSGVTPSTNQRLRAFELGKQNPTYLDVGFTKWNLRIRKHKTSKFLETIERSSYPTVPPLSLQQQTDMYKYILTMEGHVAPYRLSYELSSSSVILLVESRWKMWYSRWLKEYTHYIPIKSDLSDLIEKIEWCRTHDAECQTIVKNAQDFYASILSLEGVLDYLQRMFIEISQIVGGYSWLPNLIDLSIDDEELFLSERATPIDTDDDEEARVNPYKHGMSPGPRCIGRLVASGKALARTENLEFVRKIFVGKNCKVECMKTNGFYVARKTVTTPIKKKKQIHEEYIGLTSVNTILSACPNFVYVYGRLTDNGATFTEYIAGPLFDQWINSSSYTEAGLMDIMCGVNLALAVAQNTCAFVHYDLTPWNIIIQSLNGPVSFDYNVGSSAPIRFTSDSVLPIIIDYGKSRAVVFEEEYGGLVDRGYRNMYKSRTRAVDTLTLLYTTIDALLKAKRNVPQVFKEFLSINRLPHWLDSINVIDYVNERVNEMMVTPMSFVTFIARLVNMKVATNFVQKMNRGNVYLEEMTMIHGNRTVATIDTVNMLYRQTIPKSENAVVAGVIKNIMSLHLQDLDESVAAINDVRTRNRYELIKKAMFENVQVHSDKMLMDFPVIENGYLAIDAYLTPEEMADFLPDTVFIEGDWVTINAICTNVSASDKNLDVFGVLGDPSYIVFNYLNEIASGNTLLMISNAVQNI